MGEIKRLTGIARSPQKTKPSMRMAEECRASANRYKQIEILLIKAAELYENNDYDAGNAHLDKCRDVLNGK